LDFFFAKTLAPTVVVSNDADLITNLVALVGAQDHVQLSGALILIATK